MSGTRTRTDGRGGGTCCCGGGVSLVPCSGEVVVEDGDAESVEVNIAVLPRYERRRGRPCCHRELDLERRGEGDDDH